MQNIVEVLFYLISFSIFAVLQALFINGWNESFTEGHLLNPIKKYLSKRVKDFWLRPLFGCIRCQASLIGGGTFWCTMIPLFGFKVAEIPIYIADVFILVYLNFYFYKKI